VTGAGFRVLGPVEVAGDDGIPVRLPAGRARVVLALLCHAAAKPSAQAVSRDRLVEAVWNGAPPATAMTQLHGLVSALRRTFDSARQVIATTDDGYLLDVAANETDLGRMRELVALAGQWRDRGEPRQAAARFEDALALWRGRPFAGLDCTELHDAAGLIEQEYVSALEDYAGVQLGLGDHARLVEPLTEWTRQHPLREGLRAALIEVLARSGRQADAIAVYHDLRGRLADDLGVDPSPRLRDLYRQLVGENGTGSRPAVLPAQVPAPVADFTGRELEIKELCDALAPDGSVHPTVVIGAVTGAGGIGKSALVARVAQLMAGEFPDGQLYVNLMGASAEPAAPSEVQARLMRDLGVQAEDVPSVGGERDARYRSVLAGQRILLVLDDARDAAQVRPLLPGTNGCAVLVTSRARLADLPGVVRCDLEALTRDDALILFGRIVGPARAGAEPAAARTILDACGEFPLAIRIAGARLAARPGWSVEDMARRLSAEHDRLRELRCGDLAVRTSFQLSYDVLDEPSMRVFRLLGLAPPGELSLAAIAVLTGLDVTAAEPVLDVLADCHLIENPVAGRYRLHDLLRLFAAEKAEAELDQEERERAAARLITWYWAALRAAAGALAQGRLLAHGTEEVPEAPLVPVFATHAEALAWCDRERGGLLWAIEAAAGGGHDRIAATMACLIWMYASRVGHPLALAASQQAGLDCATAIGDQAMQAWLLTSLGTIMNRAGSPGQAISYHERALAVHRRRGSRLGQASSLNNLGTAHFSLGDYVAARGFFRQSAGLEDDRGLGLALCNEAEACARLGEHAAAAELYSAGIELRAAHGDRYGVAVGRTGLGQSLRLLGKPDESLGQLRLAVAIYRELGVRDGQLMQVFYELGCTLADLGEREQAAQAWREALAHAQPPGGPRAAEILALLDG